MQVLGIGNRLNRLKVIKAKKATGDFKDLAEAAVLEAMNVVEDNFWPIMVTMLVTMTAMAIWVWKTTPGEFIGWTRKEQEEEEEEEEEEADDEEEEEVAPPPPSTTTFGVDGLELFLELDLEFDLDVLFSTFSLATVHNGAMGTLTILCSKDCISRPVPG